MSFNTWILVAAIQGFLICIFLFSKKANRLANRFMACATMFTVIQMLMVLNLASFEANNLLLSLRFFTWINIIPIPIFIYLYIKYLTDVDPRFKFADLAHSIPYLVALLFLLPSLLLNYEDKLSFLANQNELFIKNSLIGMFISSYVILFYGNRILQKLAKYTTEIRGYYSAVKQKYSNWLYGIAFGVMTVGIIGVICSIIGLIYEEKSILDFSFYQNSIYATFIPVTLMIYWILYKALLQPELFDVNFKDWVKENTETAYQKNDKYANSNLSKIKILDLSKRLDSYMEQYQPYLKEDLSLAELATQLQVSKQILSQLLNEHYSLNFYDYINNHRLAIAKEKLLNPAFSHLTIQGISEEAGFKSKSTFYTIFKKRLGMTPTQYQQKSEY